MTKQNFLERHIHAWAGPVNQVLFSIFLMVAPPQLLFVFIGTGPSLMAAVGSLAVCLGLILSALYLKKKYRS